MAQRSFREFFNKCTFTLIAIGDSNWDYYLMQYQKNKPSVVALAKRYDCADCCFGDIAYFKRYQKANPKLILTEEGQALVG